MPRRPKTEPLMLPELRRLWTTHPDSASRTMLSEIARLHGVLRQVDQLRAVIEQVWMAERGGKLSALHSLNALLEHEPAVMEQKERPGLRKVAPYPAPIDLDDELDDMPPVMLDAPQ
jgi:hypothetical protein